MLVVTTCCIYKSTSYIYLFNNFKEKCTFSTRPRIFRDQVSQEILIGIVIFLAFQRFNFQASLDPNSTSKARTKQSPLDLEYFIFWPFHFEHLRSTMYGSGKPAIWFDKKLPCTDSFIYKKSLKYTEIFGSFSVPNDQR